MNERRPEKRLVQNLEELSEAMLDGGPLLAALVAWRLCGISKKRLYQLVKEGKLHAVWIQGVLHVELNECLKRWREL